MNIQSKARRRSVALALVAVIAIACGSILRTAVERGLVPAATVLKFWAVASPRAADRAYYRLQSDNEVFHQELALVLARYGERVPPEVLQAVRQQRKQLLDKLEQFTGEHPGHVLGLVAHADMLVESGFTKRSLEQYEKALQLSGDDPLMWREYAGRSIHYGDMRRAFTALERAHQLQPGDLGTIRDYSNALFLYRPDAMDHYGLTEAQVFDRSLELLKQALVLYPHNLDLAVDLANSYYSIKPARDLEAVEAWAYVRKIALHEHDRQQACLHMARFHLKSGELDKAAELLAQVTLPAHAVLRGRVERNIASASQPGSLVVPASFTD